MTTQLERIQRLTAFVTMVGVVLVVAWVSLYAVRDRVTSLAGSHAAVGPDGPVVLQIPGLLMSQGLDPDGRYRISIPVEVTDASPQALWIESPQYALVVRWNGEVVARRGEVETRGSWADSGHSILAVVPPGIGLHEVELELRGAFGKGGITGTAVIGPESAVRSLAAHTEALRLGLALALALLGLTHLAVATRHLWQPAYLAFGLFALLLGGWSVLQSDLAVTWLPLNAILRLRRFCVGWMPGLAVAFVTIFTLGRLRMAERGLLWASLFFSLCGLLVPSHLLYPLEVVQDFGLALALVWYYIVLAQALRRGRPWLLAMFAAALVPLGLGMLWELGISYGFVEGTSRIYVAILMFAAGSSAALALRHADDAERHRRLINGSTDAMVCVRASGEITDANAPGLAMLGEVVNLLQGVEESGRPRVRAHIAQGVRGPHRAEFVLQTGSPVPVESIATPVGDRQVLLVLRDISQRRKADEWLLKAARVETVARLVGGVAQDFNNLLEAVFEQLELLRVTNDDERVTARVDRMAVTIDRAGLLTRRLLAVSGGTGSTLGPVDIATVCRGAADLVDPTLPSGIQLTVALDSALPAVYGAAADLEHVLVNLLVNARDALGDRGHVHLSAMRFEDSEGVSGVVVVVDDDGPGVPEAMTQQVFEPFMTTKSSGTGLGLAVSAQIIRDHLGRLWVENLLGGGARFLIALRASEGMTLGETRLPDGRSVLLVEDEETVRDAFTSQLREAGYVVRSCSNGVAGMEALRNWQPDILVTDVLMPGVNGIELARSCNLIHPSVPVLLVSGYVPDLEERMVRSNGWNLLDKPVRPSRLVSLVGKLRRRAEQAARGEPVEASVELPSFAHLSSSSMRIDTL